MNKMKSYAFDHLLVNPSRAERRRIYPKDKWYVNQLKNIAGDLPVFDSGYVYYDRGDDNLVWVCLWKKGINSINIVFLYSIYPLYTIFNRIYTDLYEYCSIIKFTELVINCAKESDLGMYKFYKFEIIGCEPLQLKQSIILLTTRQRRYKRFKRKWMSMLPDPKFPMIADDFDKININTDWSHEIKEWKRDAERRRIENDPKKLSDDEWLEEIRSWKRGKERERADAELHKKLKEELGQALYIRRQASNRNRYICTRKASRKDK